MIRFARLLAASAVGTGIGIGLILCLLLNPLLTPVSSPGSASHVVTPVSLETTDWCAQQHSNDPDVQAFVDLQCAVHSVIFNDGDEPSAGYPLDQVITGPGLYDGWNHDNKYFQLEAVYVVAVDLETEAPELFAEGVTLDMVIGNLSGSAGEVPVLGSVMQFPEEDPGLDVPVLLVANILTVAEIDLFRRAASIHDGVMVQEENDGLLGPAPPPYPLATAMSLPENLSVHESDPSTVYGNGPATVDPACVQNAYDQWELDVADAEDDLENCLTDAKDALKLCAGFGVGPAALACLISGGLGCIIALGLAIGCGKQYNNAVDACYRDFENDMASAEASLLLALQACGLVIVQD